MAGDAGLLCRDFRGLAAAFPMPLEIEHDLSVLLPRFRDFDSTRALHDSPEYQQVGSRIDRLLSSVVTYTGKARESRGSARSSARAVAWNIERGIHLDAIVETLQTHPLLRAADLYFLTELDFGMARSGNRDVPGEIARRLGLNGVFAPCYLNLDRGSGLEQQTAAENTYGIHGNALFSRWPIRDPATIRLQNGKDKMRGKEKRIGSQAAVLATVELPAGLVRCASVHLDAHSTRGHRRRQLREVLDAIDRDIGLPALIGGDFNTSTHNTNKAIWAIIGFWVRVAMGVRRVLTRHYPYPERLFERRFFSMLERRGYDFRSLNELGATTLDHRILSEKDRSNLKDWLPEWCLAHVERELRPFNNTASLKLDWFAGRGLRVSRSAGALAPAVVRGVENEGRRLSDHDPIVVEFELSPPGMPGSAGPMSATTSRSPVLTTT